MASPIFLQSSFTHRALFFIGAASVALYASSSFAKKNTPKEENASPQIVRVEREMARTNVVVIAAVSSLEKAELARALIESAIIEFDRIDAWLDEEQKDNEIAHINSAAGSAPVRLSSQTFELLLEAKRLAEITHGAYDPTAAALTPLWRFAKEDPPAPVLAPAVDGKKPLAPFNAGTRSNAPPAVPNAELVKIAIGLVDFHQLHLDAPAKTAKLAEVGQRVSLRGLVNGLALSRVAALLEKRGIDNFVLKAGGDLVVRGQKGDAPWSVGIQDPRAPGHFATFSPQASSPQASSPRASPPRAFAVMTRGDYERSYMDGNNRVHDVIDPRSGFPVKGTRSVTIVADNAVMADVFSRAVFVLGSKDGLALVERTKNVDVVIVTSENRVLVSRGLRGKIQFRPPTDAP